MDVGNNLAIDFNFIRLNFCQQRESSITGAKIINCQPHTRDAQFFYRAAELAKTGDHFIFRHLHDHLFGYQPLFFYFLQQVFNGVRNNNQRHRKDINGYFMVANIDFFRQGKGN